jgi:hypothetical protein
MANARKKLGSLHKTTLQTAKRSTCAYLQDIPASTSVDTALGQTVKPWFSWWKPVESWGIFFKPAVNL